jgi:hypothetical protein
MPIGKVKIELTRDFRISAMLDRMAAYAVQAIKRRAFTQGEAAISRDGRNVTRLSDTYRQYKSGTYPYKSSKTKKAAKARRARGVRPGPGPTTETEGGKKKRLGKRPGVADQVLSGGTQKALQVVAESSDSRTLGFSTERARKVAGHLEDRNRFWGLSQREEARVVAIAEEAGQAMSESISVKAGKLSIDINL